MTKIFVIYIIQPILFGTITDRTHTLNERNKKCIQNFYADLFVILYNDISSAAENMHAELEVDHKQ